MTLKSSAQGKSSPGDVSLCFANIMQKREYETLRNHIYKKPLNIRITCDLDYQNANVAEMISPFMSKTSLQLKIQVLPFWHVRPIHKSVPKLSFESVNFAPFKSTI